jgi:hypothetical protein
MIPRIDDPHHTCLTCDWFRFPSAEEYQTAKEEGRLPPLRNRMCKGPPITEFTGVCPHWRNCYSRWMRLKAFLLRRPLRRRGITW